MNRYAVRSGANVEPLNPECEITLPSYRASGSVEQRPTGSIYVAAYLPDLNRPTRPVAQPSQSTVRWIVRGTTALRAEEARAELVALLDDATRLYIGDCWLTVVRLADAPTPEAGWGGLKHTGTHIYDLLSPEFEDENGQRGRMPW